MSKLYLVIFWVREISHSICENHKILLKIMKTAALVRRCSPIFYPIFNQKKSISNLYFCGSFLIKILHQENMFFIRRNFTSWWRDSIWANQEWSWRNSQWRFQEKIAQIKLLLVTIVCDMLCDAVYVYDILEAVNVGDKF